MDFRTYMELEISDLPDPCRNHLSLSFHLSKTGIFHAYSFIRLSKSKGQQMSSVRRQEKSEFRLLSQVVPQMGLRGRDVAQ